jgi:hypothetical protein
MPEQERPDEDLTPLESVLQGLRPSSGTLSRDRVLFEAGRSAARPGRAWPTLAVLSTTVATVLALVLLFGRPGPQIVERTVVVQVPVPVPAPPAKEATPEEIEPDLPPPPAAATLGQTDYLQRRREILRWGIDMLPETPSRIPTAAPLTPADANALSDETDSPHKPF